MSIDPHFAPHSGRDLGPWKRWVEERLKYLASGRNLISRGSVAGGAVTIQQILTDPTDPIQFQNTDIGYATGPSADITIPLSHPPKPGSEQAFYNGTPLKRADWSRNDSLLTIPGEVWFKAGKPAWVDYAYDGTQTRVPATIVTPANGSATTDNTPTIAGYAPALRALQVFVDGVSVGTTTSDIAGAWTVTVVTPLANGPHIITVDQTEPDGVHLEATPSNFAVIAVPATVRGVSTITGNHTTIPLPAGTSDGDLLVLVLCGRDTATCSDPRMDTGYSPNPGGFTPGGIWVGQATASTADIAITLIGNTGGGDCVGALLAVQGTPSVPTHDATSTGMSSPFSPTVSGAASFGIAAIFAGSGLISGSVQEEDTGVWTTQTRVASAGAGKTSVYIGTAASLPTTGLWHSDGSTAYWGARILGVQ